MIVRGLVLLVLLVAGPVVPPAQGASSAGTGPTAGTQTALTAPLVVDAAVRRRATLTATAVTLASGRVRVSVRSNATKVRLTYRSAKHKKRTVTISIRRGEAARTLPRGSRRIHARTLATNGLRASRRIAVPVQRWPRPSVMCRQSSPMLPEISGMAASVLHPGIVWVHNDSGDTARVFALDVNTCAIVAIVQLAGVTAYDFEGISMGRDPTGTPEIWVGDIGDNARLRRTVALHRFAEPLLLTDQTVGVQSVTVTWSDGARDCEALMVEPIPNGRVFLVSKEATGGVFQLQGDFRATGSTFTGSRLFSVGSSASDAAIAPDGSGTVVRFYNVATMFTGVPGTNPRPVALPTQPQGEAITYSPDGNYLYIASEGDADLVRIPVSGP